MSTLTTAIAQAATAASDLEADHAALTRRVAELEGAATTRCLYGPTVPIAGWAAVAGFVTKSGLKPGLIRCYPAGKTLEPSLSQVRKAVATYPGAAIVYNPLLAGRGISGAQLTTFVKQIEVEAKKCPRFVLVPDAEPDRKDRSYNDGAFLNAFQDLSDLVEGHAPHVEVSLNLTGYEFSKRIARYDAIRQDYDVLSLDPYWLKGSTSTVQGSTKDLNDAVAWAEANGKRLALGEWGVQGGDFKLLADALAWVRQHRIEWSCYYHEAQGNPAIGSCELTTPEAWAVYRSGAAS